MSENIDETTSREAPLLSGTRAMNDERLPHDNSTAPSKRKPMEIIEKLFDAVRIYGIAMLVVIALFFVPMLFGVAWYQMVVVFACLALGFVLIRSHGGNGWDED